MNKNTLFLFSLFFLNLSWAEFEGSDFIDASTEDECLALETREIAPKCLSMFTQTVQPRQIANHSKEKASIVGHRNILIIDRMDEFGLRHFQVVRGPQTLIDGDVQNVDINQEGTKALMLIRTEREGSRILIFSLEAQGNHSPLQVIDLPSVNFATFSRDNQHFLLLNEEENKIYQVKAPSTEKNIKMTQDDFKLFVNGHSLKLELGAYLVKEDHLYLIDNKDQLLAKIHFSNPSQVQNLIEKKDLRQVRGLASIKRVGPQEIEVLSPGGQTIDLSIP